MNLVEHGLEALFESLVLGTLVELADKVSADLERFVTEL